MRAQQVGVGDCLCSLADLEAPSRIPLREIVPSVDVRIRCDRTWLVGDEGLDVCGLPDERIKGFGREHGGSLDGKLCLNS